MTTPCYLVTKTFTEGILKGITITEKTAVKFTVGKIYKACLGATVYRVDDCLQEAK